LINLVGNAVKFTPSGSVRLVVRQRPGTATNRIIEFDVIDTGIGIEPEKLEPIFRPFEQADTSSARAFGGTGLGLAISRQLAQRLGGDITVESTLGQGSRFRLALSIPWSEGSVSEFTTHIMPCVTSACRQPDASESRPLEHARILLAEDGRDNQRLISLILRKAGADVTLVEDGQKAVSAVFAAAEAGRLRYDVVLMDMQMPIMDGYDATRRIRQFNPTLPVVALTAHAMIGDQEKCLAAGCSDFVTKPIDRATLIDAIRRHWSPSSTAQKCLAVAAESHSAGSS
jgi:CheY-like chemotaxis protein